MSKTITVMNQQIEELINQLKTFNLPVFEDDLAEDEEKEFLEKGYNFFIYETGDMFKNDDLKTISQDIAVYYYSENRDDLDEQTVKIIQALSNIKLLSLVRTQKQRLKRKDTDSYVDRIVFIYNRKIVIPGCVAL
ncbi:MAG: hypothetical protein ABS960_00645 [Solibacillus isronensis]